MAIFNVALSGKSKLIPDYSTPAFVSGYKYAQLDDTTFSLSPGSARAYGSVFNINYPSVQQNLPAVITIDITKTGINGCFPQSLASLAIANDTMFPVYVLGDSKLYNPTCAVVQTGVNVLPDGYDQYRLIGYVYIDSATGNIIPMAQTGAGSVRQYQLDEAVQVLGSGASTTPAPVSLVFGDAAVPSTATSVNLRAEFAPAAATDIAEINAFGQTSTTYPVALKSSSTDPIIAQLSSVVGLDSGDAALQYQVTDGALTLSVGGFAIDLNEI